MNKTKTTLQFDPGGATSNGRLPHTDITSDDQPIFLNVLQKTMHERLPHTKHTSVVCRPIKITAVNNYRIVPKGTLDTGASSANYIGLAALQAWNIFPQLTIEACNHTVKLGDGKTISIKQKITLTVIPIDDHGMDQDPIVTEFFIIDTMGDELIIGLPSLLSEYYDYFSSIIAKAAHKSILQRHDGAEEVIDFLDDICDRLEDELYSKEPNHTKLNKLVKKARAMMVKYNKVKDDVSQDPERVTHSVVDETGYVTNYVVSTSGVTIANDRTEHVANDMEHRVQTFQNHPVGTILPPFDHNDIPCPEDLSTPDPLPVSADIIHYMETTVQDAKLQYQEELLSHISAEMQEACPEVIRLMRSKLAEERFAPTTWNGLQHVTPITLELKTPLPTRLTPKARPIRPTLWEHAKAEFLRLKKYFYEDSTSPIASPLVIAPKATAPFIRFCGDYRVVNDYIKIPQEPIPNVPFALSKAANFPIYVDLDMTNSFHQLPLSSESANLLAVQTPWGLVQPRFLPEGVGPASGYLQKTVSKIFADYDDWIIVIFDNFLILAKDYQDAYEKLQKVLKRCDEFKIVLKLKKSYIGVKKTTFFGYEISYQCWKLSDSRKEAIKSMAFPTSKKQMQSFLGAALFFHHHIPNYSDWASELYDMTNDNFDWNPATWKKNYIKRFEDFKECLCRATEIYFPDYSLRWVVRCDASDIAVGGVLFQERILPDGTTRNEPILFVSKKFSDAARNWDAFKKEGYGMYYTINQAEYYLRGKEFIVETDHRNLQWIQASLSPIVVRWRTLLQSYSFQIRHIPGRENKVADWMSRMYIIKEYEPDERDKNSNVTFEDIMKQCHGKERLHFGAFTTWRNARIAYPDSNISMAAVRTYVKECGMCCKMRDTGVRGFNSVVKTLKPDTYRRRIGIDHVTISPPDKHGYCAAIVIVEHFSHFAQVYPVKSYDEQTLVGVMIQHFATFGLFDEIASDPGSALMGSIVQRLNALFGVTHKVSLVGRHESNGVEGTNKQIIRHLTTLVLESGVKDRWSENTVLPWINYFLNDRPTKETGRITPFQLKYGTQDAEFFRLPKNTLPDDCTTLILTKLDEDLKNLRTTSLRFQTKLAQERTAGKQNCAQYRENDLILWNPREHSRALKSEKLMPNWLGPFKVIQQNGNDIECIHVCMGTKWTFHNDRVKPYPDTEEQALIDARYDFNQFVIEKINYFKGNPHLRTSMQFSVNFIVDNEIQESTIDYSTDVAESEQFMAYVNENNYLYPLRFAASIAKRKISTINKSSIKDVNIGDELWLNLRFFDGFDRSWFDNINFKEQAKIYVVKTTVKKFLSKANNKLLVYCSLFNQEYTLTTYDIMACTFTNELMKKNLSAFIEVNSSLCRQYPTILN